MKGGWNLYLNNYGALSYLAHSQENTRMVSVNIKAVETFRNPIKLLKYGRQIMKEEVWSLEVQYEPF